MADNVGHHFGDPHYPDTRPNIDGRQNNAKMTTDIVGQCRGTKIYNADEYTSSHTHLSCL